MRRQGLNPSNLRKSTFALSLPRNSPFYSKPIFNKRRPKFMERGSFLLPDMQNLFDLGYFQGTKETVPTGWQQVDDDKTFPTLASRNPQLQQQTTEEDYEMESGQNGSESGNEDNPFHQSDREAFSSTTHMNEDSSEEEPSNPPERVSLNLYCHCGCSTHPTQPPLTVFILHND